MGLVVFVFMKGCVSLFYCSTPSLWRMLRMNERSCAGCMRLHVWVWAPYIQQSALYTHNNRETDALSKIRHIICPHLSTKRKENRNFFTFCGLVHFNIGNGHYWEMSAHYVIRLLVARQKRLYILSRHKQTRAHLTILSTDLTSSVLHRSHQLKDWLLFPSQLTFLPAMRINSWQTTPPSDLHILFFFCFFLHCIFFWLSHLHQPVLFTCVFSLEDDMRSCQPLIMCNGDSLAMSRSLLTYHLCVRSLCWDLPLNVKIPIRVFTSLLTCEENCSLITMLAGGLFSKLAEGLEMVFQGKTQVNYDEMK